MAESSTGALRRVLQQRMSLIAGLLAVALVFMLVLFFLQWYVITELFSFTADLVENQLVEEAPSGVDASEIRTTFERVKRTMRGMPLSYLFGKVHLKKAKAAADYALKANDDQLWTAEEVNTLLTMMNAAVGVKREEK